MNGWWAVSPIGMYVIYMVGVVSGVVGMIIGLWLIGVIQ